MMKVKKLFENRYTKEEVRSWGFALLEEALNVLAEEYSEMVSKEQATSIFKDIDGRIYNPNKDNGIELTYKCSNNDTEYIMFFDEQMEDVFSMQSLEIKAYSTNELGKIETTTKVEDITLKGSSRLRFNNSRTLLTLK